MFRGNRWRKLGLVLALGTGLCVTPPVEATQGGAKFRPKRSRTALLITDPQNDFMREDGAVWPLVRDEVLRLQVRENLEALLQAAEDGRMPVFISPHFYFPHDKGWKHRGVIQAALSKLDPFAVAGTTDFGAFAGSGADFYDPLKRYIEADGTVVTSPHKLFGPQSNDLVLQLRKRGIDTVILGGFAANLCTEAHLRELMEQGFKVIMVEDAVGAPGRDAYDAALLNYGMVANAVWSTEHAVRYLRRR